MEENSPSYQTLLDEVKELRLQLEEANDTIEAIRTGQVDALVVKDNDGHQLYTLKTADQTYRVFIEKMAEGAVTLNTEGIIVYGNSQFAKMTGKPLSKLIGFPFVSFIAAPSRDTYAALAAVAWQEDSKGEISLLTNMHTIPVQLSLTTLELDEGTALSIILNDLTAQKQTQLLLKANNDKLQQINHELELSNHDLQQFASVASHDLQEPLRKIQIFSNLLKEKMGERYDGETTQYLDKIIASSQRMKALIIDILNYSQLSQDGDVHVATDLNALINEVLEDHELVIREKNARVNITQLPIITVNPGQIRQVFQNLISNALKFVQKDVPPVIEISARMSSDIVNMPGMQEDIKYCYLSFRDNGIGFDEKFAANIFTLFRRLHAKDKFEGTGIGLAISKKIIEKHHGYIIAKGSEGHGSEFIIILPASQEPF